MVWVEGVGAPRVKSWNTVRAIVQVAIGAPATSCELMLMLYVPGAALFGILMVAVTGTDDEALIAIGFGGLSVQIAPDNADASQVALTWPL